ncbi:MAG: FMN-binding protein [Oscillospiraceae bacterium]
MIFLISLILAVLFVLFLSEALKKHPVPFYIAASVISISVFILTRQGVRLPSFVNTWIWPVFSRGGLAGALFVVVMITGALPNGSKAIKRLMPIRGELSIIASILTLGHNASYGLIYFRLLFVSPSRLPVNQLLAAICSLIMIAIMLPLFITSFKAVRKKMNGKSWKRLQRLAYMFYGLLYIHIMLLTIPAVLSGKSGYTMTVLIYSAIFISYTVCRVMKARAVKTKSTSHLPKRQLIGSCAAVAMSVCLTFALAACSPAEKSDPDSDGEDAGISDDEAPAGEDSEEFDDGIPDGDEPYSGSRDTESGPDAENEKGPDPSDTDANTGADTDAAAADPENGEISQTGTSNAGTPPQEPGTNTEAPSEPVSSVSPTTDSEPAPEPEPGPEPEPEVVRIYKDGSFTGTGEGYAGPVTVSVTIKDDTIISISVISYVDDDLFFSDGKAVINSILSAQSTNVDTVSGATYSSGGIIDAVAAALQSAKN